MAANLPAKKVFVGTFFEFRRDSSQDVISSFNRQLRNPDLAPFVSYDQEKHTFCFEVDRVNSDQVPQFINEIAKYLDQHAVPPKNLVDSPLLRPIEPSLAADQVEERVPILPDLNRLIVDSDDSDEEIDSARRAAARVWRPANRDVTILPDHIKESIEKLTGASLFFEPENNRVLLVNDNRGLAAERLQRLEPVLTLTAKHKGTSSSHVDANVLYLPQDGKQQKVKFHRAADPERSAYDRLMLDQHLEGRIDELCVAEALSSEKDLWTPIRDASPKDLQTTGDKQRILFHELVIPSFGSEAESKPRVTSTFTPQPVEESRFLDAQQARKVSEWTVEVGNEGASDPMHAGEDAETQTPARRRIQVDDSDSDEQDDTATRPSNSTPVVQPASTQPDLPLRVDSVQQPEFSHGISPSEASEPPVCSAESRFMVQSSHDRLTRPNTQQSHTTAQADSNRFQLSNADPEYDSGDADDLREALPTEDTVDVTDEDLGRVNTQSQAVTSVWDRTDPEAFFGGINSGQNRPAFDPNKYSNKVRGFVPRGTSQRGRSSKRAPPSRPEVPGNGRDVSSPSRNREAVRNSSSPHRGRGGRYQHGRANVYNNGSGRPFPYSNDLVDTSIDTPTAALLSSPMPPPGFSLFSQNSTQETSQSSITDGRQESLENDDPSHDAVHTRAQYKGSDDSFTGTRSSAREGSNSAFVPQTVVSKRNIKYMQAQRLAELTRSMNAVKQLSSGHDGHGELPPEAISRNDEPKSRRYHQTMNQQAPNPGKGKKGFVMQESRKEKGARIARALNESWGRNDLVNTAPPPKRPVDSSEGMTAKAKQLMGKNANFAALHPDTLRQTALSESTTQLLDSLQPIFEAGRAFKGTVEFEVQFGQAIAAANDRNFESRLYGLEDVSKMFNPGGRSNIPVVFTNKLTHKCREIEKALFIKTGKETAQLWDRNNPGYASFTLQLFCSDRTRGGVVVLVNESGDYQICKSLDTIGRVGIHHLSQTWDACAVMSGISTWDDVPAAIVEGVERLVKSIYILPNQTSIDMTYRLPQANILKVDRIVMQRISLHNCHIIKTDDFQLKITESKTLDKRPDEKDGALYHCQERPVHAMQAQDHVHYEVAILHKGANQALEENQQLDIGDLTSPDTTGKNLLARTTLRQMFELTIDTIENMECIGLNNHGNIARRGEESLRRTDAFSQMPPQVGQPLPVHHVGRTPGQTLVGGSRVSSGGDDSADAAAMPSTSRFVPGIRSKTSANLFVENGQYFLMGPGAASIPFVGATPAQGSASDPIMPNDSASQAGGRPVGGGRGSTPRRPRRTRYGNDKGPGFW